ncbi:hypothetical protein [Pseudomonas turukhanskensis]|uniref:Uncharacterized protein n=1 Tax=Pseudomonas turukhanskensis TaxID=1806536 RepID=A0A9W6K3S3_9PSED|nr:hypothetical protein [Pseudomonas turukhanskensis]GLK88327.1 hypothetical protein GCM10017655_13890 [Pseudomonas turukhanskensis]
MQPASIPLSIVQGATLRESIRVMQSTFEYRPIAAISATAPVLLTVAHELPKDWPVWIQNVQGLPELNRAFNQAQLLASVIDADTLEINAISGVGRKGAGGMLIYHPPVDLTGATAVLQVLDEKGAKVLEVAPEVHAAGWIDINLTATETSALTWRKGTWLLNALMPNGEVLSLFTGPAEVVPPGTSPKLSAISSGFVYTFGTQGPAGSGDSAELLALIAAQQQQIDEIFALVGGGESPVFVLSGEDFVMSGENFVVSSGVH